MCCTSSWAAEKYLDWSNQRPVKSHVLIGGDFSNLKFLAGKKFKKKIAEDKEKGKNDSADAVHAADIGAADFAAVLRIDRDAASAASDAASVTSQPSDGLERRRRRRLPPHRRERLTR